MDELKMGRPLKKGRFPKFSGQVTLPNNSNHEMNDLPFLRGLELQQPKNSVPIFLQSTHGIHISIPTWEVE